MPTSLVGSGMNLDLESAGGAEEGCFITLPLIGQRLCDPPCWLGLSFPVWNGEAAMKLRGSDTPRRVRQPPRKLLRCQGLLE